MTEQGIKSFVKQAAKPFRRVGTCRDCVLTHCCAHANLCTGESVCPYLLSTTLRRVRVLISLPALGLCIESAVSSVRATGTAKPFRTCGASFLSQLLPAKPDRGSRESTRQFRTGELPLLHAVRHPHMQGGKKTSHSDFQLSTQTVSQPERRSCAPLWIRVESSGRARKAVHGDLTEIMLQTKLLLQDTTGSLAFDPYQFRLRA